MFGHQLGLSNSGCNRLIKATIYESDYIALSLLQLKNSEYAIRNLIICVEKCNFR